MSISPKKPTPVRHHTKEAVHTGRSDEHIVEGAPEKAPVEMPVEAPEEVVENQVYVEQMAPAEPNTEPYEITTDVYIGSEEPVVIDMAKEPVPDPVVVMEAQTTYAPEVPLPTEGAAEEVPTEERPAAEEAPVEQVEEPQQEEQIQEESAVEQAAEIAKEAEQEVVDAEAVTEDKYHYFYCTKANGQKVTYKRNVNSKFYATEVEAFKKNLADKGVTIDSEEIK